jgi:ubiquinone/menaquinone biosynthesis C-methylase UbiE
MNRGTVVLDWGCGEALAAERIADLCDTVLLYDPAKSTRDRLYHLHGTHPGVRILDDQAVDTLAEDSIDLVIVNSVVQYLTPQQLGAALALFARALKTSGKLLLGDVIVPGTPLLHHVRTFLRFAMGHGFLVDAMVGLVSTYKSPYTRLQRDLGLAAYTDEEVTALFRQHGFAVERLARNIAVSTCRSSYVGRKSPATYESQRAPSAPCARVAT